MSQPPAATSSPVEIPPAPVRTWLSLMLFIHLFMVAVAITSYTSPSTLQQRLLGTLAPYLETFNFDLSHGPYNAARLHLTHALPMDVDFKVTVTAPLTAGGQQVVTIPESDLRGLRYRRQLSLANIVGSLAANEGVSDDVKGILPKALAAAVLAQAGVKRDTVAVTGHYLPTIEDLSAAEPQRSDPASASYLRNVYEAQVFTVAGQVNLLKTSAAGEVAPVEKGPQSR